MVENAVHSYLDGDGLPCWHSFRPTLLMLVYLDIVVLPSFPSFCWFVFCLFLVFLLESLVFSRLIFFCLFLDAFRHLGSSAFPHPHPSTLNTDADACHPAWTQQDVLQMTAQFCHWAVLGRGKTTYPPWTIKRSQSHDTSGTHQTFSTSSPVDAPIPCSLPGLLGWSWAIRMRMKMSFFMSLAYSSQSS